MISPQSPSKSRLLADLLATATKPPGFPVGTKPAARNTAASEAREIARLIPLTALVRDCHVRHALGQSLGVFQMPRMTRQAIRATLLEAIRLSTYGPFPTSDNHVEY